MRGRGRNYGIKNEDDKFLRIGTLIVRGRGTLLQPLVAFHFVQMPPYKFYFVEKLITTLQVLDLMKVV